jgi:hypothetical protein
VCVPSHRRTVSRVERGGDHRQDLKQTASQFQKRIRIAVDADDRHVSLWTAPP